MTAAGDAVLAVARTQIGVTEQPPGSSNTPYWDWYGANYGAWCACFVSWCCEMAGYPMCPVDSGKGFILVSNGTYHSYEGFEAAQEAQRTVDLQPGDVVLFSWEAWRWDGNVPVCDGGPYDGWTAGDHTGVAASTVDGAGYFRAVEGNTSDTDYGSQDNGGGVFEKTRHMSQVCGWWRPRNYGDATTPTPPEPARPKGDTMIVRNASTGQLFAVGAEGKRPLGGPEWEAWQASGHGYVDMGEGEVRDIPDVQPSMIRDPGTGAVYLVGESGKRYLSVEEYMWRSRNTDAAVWDDSAVGTIPDAPLR